MPAETITHFARRFGLSRATLLYYDRIGLLKPAAISPAGYRLYGEAEAVRMQRINTFREAGLPLKAIRSIVDGAAGDTVEAVLERRLEELNAEIGQLRTQQQLVIQLLRRDTSRVPADAVDVDQWVAMLREAGMDETGLTRWHQAFERDAPQAHASFLRSLGLSEEDVENIRSESRVLLPE